MLKFAKYFFIVFLITAILPLVLMFAWNNSQMDKFHAIMDKNLINTGKIKLEYALKNNLKVQEGDILKKLYFITPTDRNLNTVQTILKDYDVHIIDKHVKFPISFYEEINSKLYAVTLIPFDNKSKSLKITQIVNLVPLRPNGPYIIEIRFKQDNGADAFKTIDEEPLRVKDAGLLFKILDKYTTSASYQNIFKEITLLDDEDNVTAQIRVSLFKRPLKGKIDNILTGFCILIVGIISSFIIGIIIKKVFVSPIMALSSAAREIKKGNFTFRLDDSPKIDIIRRIYSNFNDMAQNLETKEKLRQSFISNLTHDLRTPLVSQAQSLEFITQKFEEIGLKSEYELAQSLAQNNSHLLKMVNLILESYCFNAEKLKLKIEKVNLCDIVNDCKEKLMPLINDKKIDFINDISSESMFVYADSFHLSRVFMNLFANAIENTSEGNYIKTTTCFEQDFVYITIEDNGNGISKEDLKFIFDRYYSGKSLERKLGSGFGLSVCKKLIEMHNGDISVQSELNSFTKFTIKLPLYFDEEQRAI